jgi:hypothetical protein
VQVVQVKLNPGLPWHKQNSTGRRLLTSKLDLNLRQKLVKCYIWGKAFHGTETWTLQKVDQKYLESFEMWCWRRMEKISWTDRVKNEEVLHRVKEGRNIGHTVKRRKANWIGHILRRNCLVKHIIEGKIEEGTEVTGRRERRRKLLLVNMTVNKRYWSLKMQALYRTLSNTRFARGYGPVVRHTAECVFKMQKSEAALSV